MDILQVTVLALVQGITEFLPISSSGHLILASWLTAWPDQGRAFDVAVHGGSLCAVVGYFRTEIRAMLAAWLHSLSGNRLTPDARLAWLVIVATLPVLLAGALLQEPIEAYLRSALVIAAATMLFGVLLWWSDRTGLRDLDEYSLTWKSALIIGLAQALALIPGTSRSGITITAALFLGLERQAAARFSFLLSVPTIGAASVLLMAELVQQTSAIDGYSILLGAVFSGLSAYLCIHFFLRALQHVGMLPFMLYRLCLGIVIIIVFYAFA